MNPSELRIGNFLSYKGDTCRVRTIAVSLHKMGVGLGNAVAKGKNLNVISYEDCIPIPLDENWLDALGFSETQAVWQHGFITIVNEGGSFAFNGLVGKKVQIHHVHHLQNLYYALNNDELKIDHSKLPE